MNAKKKKKKKKNKKTTKRNQNQIYSVDEEPFWQGTILPEDYSVKKEKWCLNGVKALK